MDIAPVTNQTTCQVSTKAGQDHLAPGQGPLTAREHTTAVADRQGGALGGLDHPGAGDIFFIPASWPLSNVFSAGDVLIVLGLSWGLHRICGSRLVPSWVRSR